ncbi:MAG TPA: threonine--tRNA ligase [Candidatus Latescibacteria bacterium]|nr:threonine--tRNA ligase [Candidatus Latescibacterota bacterium]
MSEEKLISVTFSDGVERRYPAGTSLFDIVAEIDLGSNVPLVARVDGRLVDLSTPVTSDCAVKLLSFESPEGKGVYWHSTSHILAQAVKELFPEAKLGVGPSIENGFYYDFDVQNPFSPGDLEKIEERMRRIVKADLPFRRKEVSRAEAQRLFTSKGEDYKVELIEELDAEEQPIIYQQDGFIDLCRGPHLPSTGYIKAFKLLSSSGAYWKGNERNPMLQRIYGISFPEQKQLDEYLSKLEEAKRRDHRRLGQELDLYSVHEDVGAGLIHWHPNGAVIRNVIEEFWKEEHWKRGYKLVYTPHIASERIYQISGHIENYSDLMYSPMDIDGIPYRLKPMNCPGHILIFKTRQRSYRDLPIRYAELGTVYRYERSGVLHGMLRVRGFTQDDSHIFCTEEQLPDEIVGVLDLVQFMMDTFGYSYKAYLSTRPEKSIGSDEAWEKATNTLRMTLEKMGLDYQVDPGEGVFYGPKIDIELEDALGREWQGPTIQVDFNLPERFDINYIGQDGREHSVVMIHRTVLGAMERFIGGLIEHYGGAFPVWLAPIQVAIIPITDVQMEYSERVAEALKADLIRVWVDRRSEKIGHKIRDAEIQKIPYMLVVGSREVKEGTLSLRKRGEGDLGSVKLEEFRTRILDEIRKRM